MGNRSSSDFSTKSGFPTTNGTVNVTNHNNNNNSSSRRVVAPIPDNTNNSNSGASSTKKNIFTQFFRKSSPNSESNDSSKKTNPISVRNNLKNMKKRFSNKRNVRVFLTLRTRGVFSRRLTLLDFLHRVTTLSIKFVEKITFLF